MKKTLTIAILTYKRLDKLQRCLKSIYDQSALPQFLIIIDNENSKSTAYALNNKFPVQLIYKANKRNNIPYSRNLALNQCKTDYLAFIDDDCILDIDWTKNVLSAIIKYPQAAYILGENLLFNSENIFASAQYVRQMYWFKHKLRNFNVTSGFNFDTKNVIININLIDKYKIRFDNKIFIKPIGDHADTDFGLQLDKAKLKGFYLPQIKVHHEDVSTFTNFIKKAFIRGKTAALIYHKWSLHKELVFLPEFNWWRYVLRLKNWPVEFSEWTKSIKSSWFKKIQIFLLVKLYDRLYLEGFIKQAKISGFNWNDWLKLDDRN